ncbi:acyl-CoA dehydrogenase family protein [Nocardia ignorata]|uniref:acyl-CoA dehydrogenase family protein n=1 Tax=Nocardia ignorata TaxID=145285 RepID=UPI00363695E8
MTSTITSATDRVALARTIGETLRTEVAERDRTGEISVAAFDLLRSSGLSAALVPAEFGGGGATHTEMGAVLRELGAHDPSTAVAFAMHSHLVAAQVWRHKHGIDASGVFAKVVGGAILVSTGASDWVDSNGMAVPVDGGYRVSARKAPASGCEAGDVLVTSVRLEGNQVLHCAIPMSAIGVRIEKTWDTLGLRASGSHTVVLDEVFVPEAAVSLIRPAGGTVRLAVETTGGAGYSRTCDLERLYRDVLGCQFHPLPRAKQTRFSGRVLLGHTPIDC